MKETLLKLMKYVLKEYPFKTDLSASRLVKMLYLADWKNAIESGSQITDIRWTFHHYGPYTDDVIAAASADKDIDVKSTRTVFGGRKQQFELLESFDGEVALSDIEKKRIDFVIEATKNKTYDEFIRLVYSTYPIMSSKRYDELNLVEMASTYKLISEKRQVAAG